MTDCGDKHCRILLLIEHVVFADITAGANRIYNEKKFSKLMFKQKA